MCIIGLAAWALWPPANEVGESHAIASPTQLKKPVDAKYVLRVHPGPLYLPGLMPENATKPIEGMAKVAAEFERRFPDTHIEFVAVPSGQREWLVTQLSGGQAPDIIQVNVEDVWQDVQKGWYAPLDHWLEQPNPFVKPGDPGSTQWWDVFKYQTVTRGKAAPDGKNYCISLDMIETGIFYNKAVFDRLGLKEPKDWNEFLQLHRTLEENGFERPMLIDQQALADWGVDLMFDQFYGAMRPLLDIKYDSRRGEYLKGYLDWDELIFLHSKGFFTPQDPRWRAIWRTLHDWRRYMSKNLSSTDFIKSFVTEKGIMYWMHSMLVNKLVHDPNLGFEWGIFYLPPVPHSFSRFADGHEMAVIGGSAMQYCATNTSFADTGNPQSSERFKRAVAFLQFLTTPKPCDQVVNEVIAFLPNVKGVAPQPQLQPFDDFLHHHYAMTKWFYTFGLQFDEVMLRMFDLYLNNGMTEDEFLGWMERNINTAAQDITSRKDLDFSKLQKEWDARAELRKQFTDLPDGAN